MRAGRGGGRREPAALCMLGVRCHGTHTMLRSPSSSLRRRLRVSPPVRGQTPGSRGSVSSACLLCLRFYPPLVRQSHERVTPPLARSLRSEGNGRMPDYVSSRGPPSNAGHAHESSPADSPHSQTSRCPPCLTLQHQAAIVTRTAYALFALFDTIYIDHLLQSSKSNANQ